MCTNQRITFKTNVYKPQKARRGLEPPPADQHGLRTRKSKCRDRSRIQKQTPHTTFLDISLNYCSHPTHHSSPDGELDVT